jgi:hypoxanthine phosphoribosyltransferase
MRGACSFPLYGGARRRDTPRMTERLVEMISAETLRARTKELGAKISEDYKDRNLVLVSILKGSFIFAADLMREITVPCRIDFLGVRSYGEGTETSGVVQITNDLSRPIDGADVLIVEDIVDTGLTIAYLMDLFRTRSPRSVKVAALLHKPARARVVVPVDYLGFTIEDKFVVGYGLDFNEKYRNLPYVGIVERT